MVTRVFLEPWECHHLNFYICLRRKTMDGFMQPHFQTQNKYQLGRCRLATLWFQLLVCTERPGYSCYSGWTVCWSRAFGVNTGAYLLYNIWSQGSFLFLKNESWINHYTLCVWMWFLMRKTDTSVAEQCAWSTYHLVSANDDGLSQHKLHTAFHPALSPIQWLFKAKPTWLQKHWQLHNPHPPHPR